MACGIGGTFILYKVLTLPEKLGEEIGKAVADDLSGMVSWL
jgi:hypothetical protein